MSAARTPPCDVVCTTFRGVSPTPAHVDTHTWADFVCQVLPALVASTRRDPQDASDKARAVAKKRFAGFVLAPVYGRRVDSAVGAHTALAIDVDALPGNDLRALLKQAKRLGACAVYETPSSTDDAPRVRVIAALRRPLPPAQVPAARLALAAALGLDPEACGTARALPASQVMFAGRFRSDRERGIWTYEGNAWRPPSVRTQERPASRDPVGESQRLRSRGTAVPGAFPFDAPPDLSAVGSCVPPAGTDGDRHLLVRALGGWLARRGYSPEAVAEAVRLHIPASDPAERATQALDAARRVLAGLESPGWDALSAWADLYGRGRKTLKRLEAACRDPREPEGWGAEGLGAAAVWSEWWARYWPRLQARSAATASYHGKRSAAKAERAAANAAALAESAPGLDGLECDDEGRPLGTVDNTIRCVRHFLGHALGLDVATGAAVLLESVRLDRGPGETLEPGPWRDMYTTRMQAALNRLRIRHAYAGDTRSAVYAVASERPIDVLGDWLRALAGAWDGKARVDGALARYWRADDEPLTTVVSRIMLLGIAARGLHPGCELHTVPVLIGQQGCGKSSSLKALMWGERANWPDPTAAHGYGAGRRYCGSKLEIGKKDALASIRGHLVWELAELASVKRADIDDVKAWITQSADTFRPPFAHEDVTYQRTVAPIANVNPDSTGHVVINRDTSGGRRWAPVRVAPGYVWDESSTHRLGVREAELIRDREQLLGEAARRVLDGEPWHPTAAEAALLAPAVAEVSEDPTRGDPWYAPIARWARAQDARKGFAIAAVFHSALDMVDVAKHSRGEALRIAHVLRDLGYVCGAPNNGVRKWRKMEAGT